MSNHEFVVDPNASALKKGERPETAGLVVVVGWGWGLEPDTLYDSLAANMRALDPDSLHVYEGQHLHCTGATLSR